MLPTHKHLVAYADILVNYALNSGQGIKKGELVFLEVPECAKPLLKELQIAVLNAGAHYITRFIPDDLDRLFYDHANDEQLNFFPEHYLRGKVAQADYSIGIIAETNKRELFGIDPKKIMHRSKAFKNYREWREEKENLGKFTWTLALYGTEAMAKEANLTLEEYWDQIIRACYLDNENPLKKWREIFEETNVLKNKLNELKIDKLRVISNGTDLIVGLGSGRSWLGGSGRNIPSFEVFISPDCRRTHGHITFNQPLYRYGNVIKNISLEFKEGRVVNAQAKEGQELLREMIATSGADMIGEFSLTDARLSRIDKFMAETLYDENIGQPLGNTHLALGAAYKDSYPGDPSKLTKEDWENLGYNDSVVHTDIISTEDRKVYATLPSGSEILIYEEGKFVI